MITLTDNNFFDTVVALEEPVLVDFWAAWCGPCKRLDPVLDSLSLVIGKVNVDENPILVSAFKISSVPTLILFVDAKPVARFTGVKTKTELEQELAKWL